MQVRLLRTWPWQIDVRDEQIEAFVLQVCVGDHRLALINTHLSLVQDHLTLRLIQILQALLKSLQGSTEIIVEVPLSLIPGYLLLRDTAVKDGEEVRQDQLDSSPSLELFFLLLLELLYLILF